MSEDVFHLGIKGLIRNQKNEILLLQVNPANLHGGHKDYWDLPGGRIQKGDSPEDTLKREVFEETSVTAITDIRPVTMLLSNIRIPTTNNDSVGLILSVYNCTIPDDVTILLSDEHIAYEWFTPSEASGLLQVKYPMDFCKAVANLE